MSTYTHVLLSLNVFTNTSMLSLNDIYDKPCQH